MVAAVDGEVVFGALRVSCRIDEAAAHEARPPERGFGLDLVPVPGGRARGLGGDQPSERPAARVGDSLGLPPHRVAREARRVAAVVDKAFELSPHLGGPVLVVTDGHEQPVGRENSGRALQVGPRDVFERDALRLGQPDEARNPSVEVPALRDASRPDGGDGLCLYPVAGVRSVEALAAPVVVGLHGVERHLQHDARTAAGRPGADHEVAAGGRDAVRRGELGVIEAGSGGRRHLPRVARGPRATLQPGVVRDRLLGDRNRGRRERLCVQRADPVDARRRCPRRGAARLVGDVEADRAAGCDGVSIRVGIDYGPDRDRGGAGRFSADVGGRDLDDARDGGRGRRVEPRRPASAGAQGRSDHCADESQARGRAPVRGHTGTKGRRDGRADNIG